MAHDDNDQKEWHEYPMAIAAVKLVQMRDQLRRENLHDTEDPPLEVLSPPAPADGHNIRTADGTYNDLSCPRMGSAGIRFGRNVPVNETFPDIANLMNPSPRR